MKILITDMLGGNGGGHVTYIMSLLQGLEAHELVVAAPEHGRLYRLASALPGQRTEPRRYTSRLFQLIPEVYQLRRFIQQEQFDLIHVNGSADHRHVMLACLGMRRRPAIVWKKHNTRPVNSFGNCLRAHLATDAVIAGCKYVARVLQQSPYRHVPTTVVRQVIDTSHYHPLTLEEKQRWRQHWFGELSSDSLVFASVGGTDYDKGWLLLVEAAARLPLVQRQRIRILVAGDPPKSNLKQRVDELNMTEYVVFPGLVNDVREVLGAADIGFVLSSHEAGSYACLEAMAMGLPALVTAVGGLPENVNDGIDGWIVPSGEVKPIENLLNRLLADSSSLVAMGVAARQWACGQFEIPRFVAQTEAVYEKALAKRKR